MTHPKRIALDLTVVLLLLFASYCHGQIDCSSPPEKSCAFYEECLEAKYHCGPKGYPIGFGKKFCDIFESSVDEFSPRGQDFLWSAMHRLQTSLVTPLMDNTTSIDCQAVKQIALDSHSTCLIQSGFCETFIKDKVVLAKLLLENDISDIFWSFVHQVLEVLNRCIFRIDFL